MRDFAKAFYKSQAWKNTRRAYLHSVGGLCERCLSRGKITPAALVHHKVHLSPDNIDDESVTLSWNNLQALCRTCHAEVHSEVYEGRRRQNALKKRYIIGVDGKILIRDDEST